MILVAFLLPVFVPWNEGYYIFTLVYFVWVVTSRHSGRSFEPESNDFCC
ncbi:protein of unknown function [Shewanella benthica]|uniref:Uncharacterized protein n=1 Tax=Shewanella benthica TaxID=43661 RepID=A0A330M7T7_9GAMM|nr:protein of unknown function [Shewanella benthica]